MKKLIFTLILFITIIQFSKAQEFELTAELRPRFESKHGFKTLIDEDTDAANFVSQRTRLNFNFKNEKLKAYVSLQNVRIWGDVTTLANDDNASSLHEAWAEAILTNKITLKIGRQEIVYDDQRIFGSVGWAQQARSHDAFIFKYTPNQNSRLDIGIALNENNGDEVDDLYTLQHKNFQYGWFHKKYEKISLSLLALNTGYEFENADLNQETDYMQTIGARVTYKKNKLSANFATYLQFGKKYNTDVNSSYYTGNLAYKLNANFDLGLGYEHLSGKDQDDTSNKIKSFAPLFGTNHKFNGWMDYFYVGNHANNVGLDDINLTLSYKKDKFSAKLVPHIFYAANDVYQLTKKMDRNLGTEIDLTIGYKIAKDIKLSAGYSQMFGSNTLEELKGGDKDENNSWAWLMFTFKPTLFSHKTVK